VVTLIILILLSTTTLAAVSLSERANLQNVQFAVKDLRLTSLDLGSTAHAAGLIPGNLFEILTEPEEADLGTLISSGFQALAIAINPNLLGRIIEEGSATFHLSATATNPSLTGATLDPTDISIQINGVHLASVSVTRSWVIPPRQTQAVEIDSIVVPFKGIPGVIASVIANDFELEIGLALAVHYQTWVGSIDIPLSGTVTFPLVPTLPSVETDLSGIDHARLLVRNPSDEPLRGRMETALIRPLSEGTLLGFAPLQLPLDNSLVNLIRVKLGFNTDVTARLLALGPYAVSETEVPISKLAMDRTYGLAHFWAPDFSLIPYNGSFTTPVGSFPIAGTLSAPAVVQTVSQVGFYLFRNWGMSGAAQLSTYARVPQVSWTGDAGDSIQAIQTGQRGSARVILETNLPGTATVSVVKDAPALGQSVFDSVYLPNPTIIASRDVAIRAARTEVILPFAADQDSTAVGYFVTVAMNQRDIESVPGKGILGLRGEYPPALRLADRIHCILWIYCSGGSNIAPPQDETPQNPPLTRPPDEAPNAAPQVWAVDPSPAVSLTAGQTQQFKARVIDSDAVDTQAVEWFVNSDSYHTDGCPNLLWWSCRDLSPTYSHTFTTPGTYRVTVRAIDRSNLYTDASWTVTVAAPTNAAPVITPLSPSSTLTLARGQSQQFKAQIEDADGVNKDVRQVFWSVNGVQGKAEDCPTWYWWTCQDVTSSFSHTFSNAGRYTVTVRAIDYLGESAARSWVVTVS
jgi:hypothetical protein